MAQGDYSEIGMLLKQAREEMGLSLDEAARRIYMRARYVAALEEGKFGDLPSLIYVRGYLSTYAGFLRLDRREILRRFDQVENTMDRKGFYLPQVFSSAKDPSRALVWGGALAALALYALWLMAMRPERAELSVVEPLPQPLPHAALRKPAIPAAAFQDVACLRPPNVLYPPCHSQMAGILDFLALPDSRTIMKMQEKRARAAKGPEPLPELEPGAGDEEISDPHED